MSSEFSAHQIAGADQLLADAENQLAVPLRLLRQKLDAGDDPTVTYLRISRDVARGMEQGGRQVRASIAMSYVAALFVLDRRNRTQ
ncbi:hypothetical protein SEA_NAIRB_50 [Mycobacterium phage Nairb]|uniref:Uncharacterized protein n=5 Tax=Bernalvirus bernal13 TaxID=1982102 RepID=A0A2P1JRR2_9CAUD|nr:hypothetical protein FH37_gp50 [Mycobacterium phage Bernal13]AIT13464.1 hypothetical protein PBI_RONRAYGUN_51 [Mycobacterium phage RonRayGun]ASJ79131.1 hypothetical protein SEA_ZENTIME222_50 [Mycobacterium phage ZenTime222]AVO21838.1 hypothetical protein SEA_NAIRB_50 [Mycobacterium phage Nairb]QBP28896.1 hypothetical protein SEA_IBRAHIM_51 [Mycobacterium phage Ibrahim]QHB47455.1 hypothetical protein SEA_WHITTY_50 [Mycobacterium phage Whitty]